MDNKATETPVKVTRVGAWSRCILVDIGTLCAFLLTNSDFTSHVTWQGRCAVGAVAVLSLQTRQFMDKSQSQADVYEEHLMQAASIGGAAANPVSRTAQTDE